jgi:hypothetical protein
VEVQLHIFLTSALEEGDWSASRTERFIIVTHWIGSLVTQVMSKYMNIFIHVLNCQQAVEHTEARVRSSCYRRKTVFLIELTTISQLYMFGTLKFLQWNTNQ